MKQSTRRADCPFCWMLTVFIISKSSLDMFHSNQIQILLTVRHTLTLVNCSSLNMLLIWEMNFEDMNTVFYPFENIMGLFGMNIRSNWDSICPKPWEGFVGSWHCFISWHMWCYHVILFYNNLLFYFEFLSFLCNYFIVLRKAFKNVIFCALELVRPLLRNTGSANKLKGISWDPLTMRR